MILALVISISHAHADRGPVIWSEGVKLTQESQKAIIMHNTVEEVLVLGTELRADKETDILEFIPFPSEPRVSLAKGDPFEKISRIISEKKLMFRFYDMPTKGGGGKDTTVPVEISFAEKIGVHDVTTIKINDIDHFSKWVDDFFRGKGIKADRDSLSRVYENARDYMERGFNHFVFDFVKVTDETKFIEPLIYRFQTEKIYYPLKTSNLISGRGVVEMIFILPGSFSDEIWQQTDKIFPAGAGVSVSLSSSSKMYPGEVGDIYRGGPFFGKTDKIYIQMLKYDGPYMFKDDFLYPTDRLTPYAYKHRSYGRIAVEHDFTPPFTRDEKRDLREVFCHSDDVLSGIAIRDYGLDCWSFIPNVEYEVYAALLNAGKFDGVPSGPVVLENNTTRREFKDKTIDKDMLKDFNNKNKVEYPLENAFYESDGTMIRLRRDVSDGLFYTKGKTRVSRVGFNKDKTMAVVYMNHVAEPAPGMGYLVVLGKKDNEWRIESSYADGIDEK